MPATGTSGGDGADAHGGQADGPDAKAVQALLRAVSVSAAQYARVETLFAELRDALCAVESHGVCDLRDESLAPLCDQLAGVRLPLPLRLQAEPARACSAL